MNTEMPRWVEIGVIPLINIMLALVIAGLIILFIGENPIEAVGHLVRGAFGSSEGTGYTLYYTTNFIFTGLAVAIAFHAGLFNIGGEGQAYIGGLGIGLLILALDGFMPLILLIPLGIMACALFGAAWAFIPAYLQAYRGSHIVITTIMFNFIASSLMVYLLVNVLIKPGQMSPETREFAESSFLPFMHEMLAWIGITVDRSPLNLSFVWALICAVLIYFYIWRTRWGYALRCTGANDTAAHYAGIDTRKVIIATMCISGGLAGFVGFNELMGINHRILLNFHLGYGFTGIAVALMGRNHPVGVIMASLLFGALYQGGTELSFEMPKITREMVVVIQGLIILFSGALAYMITPYVEMLWHMFAGKKSPDAAASGEA